MGNNVIRNYVVLETCLESLTNYSLLKPCQYVGPDALKSAWAFMQLKSFFPKCWSFAFSYMQKGRECRRVVKLSQNQAIERPSACLSVNQVNTNFILSRRAICAFVVGSGQFTRFKKDARINQR